MSGFIGVIRAPRQRIILSIVVLGLGLAQVITGAALSDDVYSWGASRRVLSLPMYRHSCKLE